MDDHSKTEECRSKEEWNDFVRRHGTLHHMYEWTFVNQKTFRCECVNLAYRKGNAIVAIYPFIRRGRWPLRWYVSPTDFGGGPIGEPGAIRELIEEVERKARRERVIMNVIRYGNEYVQPLHDFRYDLENRGNLVIDLARSQERIWASFKDTVRNSIRKSTNQGIEVTEGSTTSDLEGYLSLVRRHSLTIGYRPRSEVFIRCLFRYLDATLLVARWHSQLVGGAVYLNFNGRASCINASRDPDMAHLRIGEALHWMGIKHYVDRGFTAYDFMSRNDNIMKDGVMTVSPELASLHRFKQGWQPNQEPACDLTYTYSQRGLDLRRTIASLRNRVVNMKQCAKRMVTAER